jgi:serine/threonine protein kinase
MSFEGLLESVEDKEVREVAIDFVRKCLQWLPKDRLSARELVKHPFLTTPRACLWEASEYGQK